jgi:hypothetical protein
MMYAWKAIHTLRSRKPKNKNDFHSITQFILLISKQMKLWFIWICFPYSGSQTEWILWIQPKFVYKVEITVIYFEKQHFSKLNS